MKTDYFAHDKAYQNKKAQGDPGWDSQEQLNEDISGLEELIREGYIPDRGKFLELGCGAGNITIWFAKRGYEAYGVDISPFAIQWAMENARETGTVIDYKLGNVVDLPDYQDESFDFVLDGHCLHCIIGEDRRKLLTNVFRVLKPGGAFIVRTMCGDVIDEKLKHNFDPISRTLYNEGIAQRYFGFPADILAEIRQPGFRIDKFKITPAFEEEIVVVSGELFVSATKTPL